jgi:hypothetical protein
VTPEVVFVVATDAPEVRLLDGRAAGLDRNGLREWARSETASHAAAHAARSYRYPYALIAWHRTPVGVDIERIGTHDDAFAETVCTPTELQQLSRSNDRDLALTSLWASKEALAKALGDAVDYLPGRLESPCRWPRGTSGRWRAEQLWIVADHVGWICWQEGRSLAAERAAARRR